MAASSSGKTTLAERYLRAVTTAVPDDEVTALLAYGLAAREAERRGAALSETSAAETVTRHRREAEAMLAVWSHRYLHNRMEELRLEGVQQHLARLPRPLGFLRLALACAVGTSAVGVLALWVAGHDGTLAGTLARALEALSAVGGG